MPKNSIYNFLKLGTDGPICSENIVFLLGAGASRDAGIPTLAEMSNSFEMKMQALEPDHIQRRLYNYFKEKSKSDKYSLGSSANVEDMLAIMEDLLHMHQERSVMYDLVSGWDKELMEIFQFDFGKIRELKNQLKDHVTEELCGKKGGSTLELDYFPLSFLSPEAIRGGR